MSAQPISAAELLLAIDVGGTKTSACFARRRGSNEFEILGRGRTSGANPLTIGIDRAVEAIAAAARAAREDAKLTSAAADRAVLSIAGAADPTIAGRLVERLRSTQIAGRIAIVSDVLPILATVADQGIGIALISGTGSVAFGRRADGCTQRCGGWGYLLGDDGSGYAIGRAALRLALDDFEAGATQQSPLTMAILAALEANSAAELIKSIYNHPNPRARIASLAVQVVAAADARDPAARAILDAAARDLANLTMRTARSLELQDATIPLALAGGVLAGSDYLRAAVALRLRDLKLHVVPQIVTDPLDGCLRLANSEFGEASNA